MTQTCPDCGTPVEYVERAAQVLTGNCADCGHAFTILQGAPDDVSNLPARAAKGARTPTGEGDEPVEIAGDRPKCDDCGSTLSFRIAEGRGVEGVCPGCQSKFAYVLSGGEAESAPRMRPYRERPSGGRDADFGAPRSRPCRECGGPLRFATNPDGTVGGECSSCGNKFTLPPRRDDDGGGRGDRGGGRPFNRNYAPRSGGGGRWSPGGGRGGPRRFDGPRGPPRSREGARGGDDRDDYRKRRRPSRD
jgi:ribosomal protein L37AE/L43A